MSNIYDIDFSSPHDDFMKSFQNHLDNWGNNNMDCTSTENGTKNGKYMYKIEIKNKDVDSKTTLLFEKNGNNGDVMCVPSGFHSFGGTFFKHEYSDNDVLDTPDDTMWAAVEFLSTQAKMKKGKFVASYPRGVICIKDGNIKNAKECIVDSDGNVYGSKEVSVTSVLGDVMVQFKTPIGDWIKLKRAEDPNFAAVIADKSKTMSDKMNYIGQYLIAGKTKDEIDSEEFKDIFHQAGLIGFSDPTVSNIYKLIV